MPVTQIETADGGSKKVLLRLYQHDCSLGEMADRFQKEIMVSIVRRMSEGKERFNWHDVTGDAAVAMEKAGITREVQWQVLSAGYSVPPDVLTVIRRYNDYPKPTSLIKVSGGASQVVDAKPKD